MTSVTKAASGSSPIIVEGALIIPYRYALGTVASRFYTELRDHARLLATRCSTCGKVYMPPVATCLDCFSLLTDWTQLAPRGTVSAYTVVRRQLTIHPKPAPLIYAIIRLDGADTGLVHLLDEVRPEDVHVGLKVRAVFREKREGTILDIDHFKPLRRERF